ncbi:gliding motility-associated C-terminal domain-containing protein [Hymenobacter sp. HSC-4F20]|uniref:T9SS type B sorting domain-containing protein n=1 Tax=Hymenobacter sp. HSC-4F20 TaxID=2864135 RepID=UPI001C7319F6|nr:gliding motility-associated C-terminal domain-containing protein [Hymenobacter sp. HSC-4F20]MBX0290082.1 gliding motility-associated C-terminal domain-containing protein [Hymenobacter sp. HSC-4F20]
MMKNLLLLLLLVVGLSNWAWAQCDRSRPCNPTPGISFKIYDAATKQEVQELCVGRRVRFVNTSSSVVPGQEDIVRYATGSTVLCCGADFPDTVSFYTPTAPGTLVITQNKNPAGSSLSIISSRNIIVRNSTPPAFTLTACAPGFVEVTVTDANYDQYLVQVGSAAPVPAPRNTPVTYPASGPATVTVVGRYNQAALCEGVAQQSFTPRPAPQRPTLSSLAVQGTTAQFQFGNLQPEYQYRLQVADAAAGGYRTLATLTPGATSFDLATAPLPGCYRLLLQDACQPSVASTASFSICSVTLTGASQNGRNLLRWGSEGSGSYTLTRSDGQNTLRLPLPPGTTQYEDTAVACGTTYRYRVSLTMGITTSVSDEVAVLTSAGAAPAAPRLAATFNLRNQVELTAVAARNATTGQLTYLRNGAELRTTSGRTLVDSLVTPALSAPLCYSVRLLDVCGNRSPESAPVCPVLLEAQAVTDDGTTIRLNWTALRGPDATVPVTYRLLTLSATNTVLRSLPVPASLTYLDLQPPTDQQVVRYRIEATGGGLSAPSYSNIATVARRIVVYVPTAFTPNGDGLNDVLELKGRYLDAFRFTVVDRNGQAVFQATSRAQTWDGRIGSAAPVPGAYVWRFEATDQTGRRSVQQGTVTILR